MTLWRRGALALSALSAMAMLYVGLYQSRTITHIWCPLSGQGCKTVADAGFAHPMGIPDGYLGAGLYGAMVLMLFVPRPGLKLWRLVLGLSVIVILTNLLGISDMMKLGAYCTYCMATAIASPLLLWAVWRCRPSPHLPR